MSLENMPGFLCGISDGTTINAKKANNIVPCAGDQQCKSPIYVSAETGVRNVFTWWRAITPHRYLSAEKRKMLMIVLRTAGGFKAAISPLGLLDRGNGVSFHTFRLPEGSGVRLLIKKLSRQKPEDVSRDDLDALGFRV
jgi:hypothetical protein